MDNKQAIENLQTIKEKYTWSSGADEALDMGMRALQTQPKWTPVIEKLPKEGTLVLCSVRDEKHSVIITQYNAEQYWFDGKIVAWMPLPIPWEGVSE